MSEYLVFPIPIGLIKVTASGHDIAIRKYRKEMPEMCDEELIVVPAAYGQRTINGNILPLWKCDIEKVK